MDSTIIDKGQRFEHVRPLVFCSGWQGPDHIAQCPIESLNTTVTHRVVGSCVRLLHPSHTEELCDEIALKVGSLVRMCATGEAIDTEDVVPRLMSNGLC